MARHVEHPQAVHEEVLRLSNREEHGVTLVGPQWHQDGSTERVVFSLSAVEIDSILVEFSRSKALLDC